MSNVVELFPRKGADIHLNLTRLVEFYTRNSPFKSKEGWAWNNVYWDVKGICKTQARKAGHDLYIYFSQDNKKGSNVKTSRAEMQSFHHQELSDVVKCHVTALQIESSKDAGSLQLYVNAYRYLDNVLSISNKRIAELSSHEFRLAEQEARENLADSTFYRMGQKLEVICKFINQHGLAKHKINFRKTAKRSQIHTNSDTRIDQSSIDERAKKLPTKQSLIAVATLSNADLKDDDALFQSLTEIMFATGLRFDEVVALDKDCLNPKVITEKNVLTGELDEFTSHELRYRAKKGGGFRTKTIADKMLPILQKGINTALAQLSPVREIISAVRQDDYDFFPELEQSEAVFIDDIWKLLGWTSNSNLQTYLKQRDIPVFQLPNPKKNKRLFAAIAPSNLRRETLLLAQESIKELWKNVRSLTVAENLEDMLFVTQHQRHHAVKRTEEWKFTPITHTQYSDYIAGRPDISIYSVFERNNLMFDDKPIRLTSHQFRHFLNTMLSLADTVSDIDIARYFGRKYTGDNETYDHTNKAKMVMDHVDDIIASTGISREQAKEAAILFTLVDKDEALETIEDLTTTLTTSIGLCRHDYNDSPCGKHYACLRGCFEYYRIKGNSSEVDEVTRIRDQQILHVTAAKRAVAEEFHNSNNWLVTHEELFNGCEIALAIENDDGIAVGQRVQIFPEGKNRCKSI
jgi:hypothetical protein